LRVDFEYAVQQCRFAVEHGLDGAEVVAASPFDHITGQRVRAAGETDQRHLAVERAADLLHGIEYITQRFARIRYFQRVDCSFIADRSFEFGALALGEIQAEAHGIGHGQNVGEQDRGIRETVPAAAA
jgi:hypothetical protein